MNRKFCVYILLSMLVSGHSMATKPEGSEEEWDGTLDINFIVNDKECGKDDMYKHTNSVLQLYFKYSSEYISTVKKTEFNINQSANEREKYKTLILVISSLNDDENSLFYASFLIDGYYEETKAKGIKDFKVSVIDSDPKIKDKLKLKYPAHLVTGI